MPDRELDKQFINSLCNFEDVLARQPGALFGDDAAPLKHTFADGLYIRQITMPKGMLVTSKIHKTTHPYFILRGTVVVETEAGIVTIKGPYQGITRAGTKRLIYVREETVWITVHATDKTDPVEIEKDIIAEDYNALKEQLCPSQQ